MLVGVMMPTIGVVIHAGIEHAGVEFNRHRRDAESKRCSRDPADDEARPPP